MMLIYLIHRVILTRMLLERSLVFLEVGAVISERKVSNKSRYGVK